MFGFFGLFSLIQNERWGPKRTTSTHTSPVPIPWIDLPKGCKWTAEFSYDIRLPLLWITIVCVFVGISETPAVLMECTSCPIAFKVSSLHLYLFPAFKEISDLVSLWYLTSPSPLAMFLGPFFCFSGEKELTYTNWNCFNYLLNGFIIFFFIIKKRDFFAKVKQVWKGQGDCVTVFLIFNNFNNYILNGLFAKKKGKKIIWKNISK